MIGCIKYSLPSEVGEPWPASCLYCKAKFHRPISLMSAAPTAKESMKGFPRGEDAPLALKEMSSGVGDTCAISLTVCPPQSCRVYAL